MKYYAIPDLHGMHDLLLEGIGAIYDHAGTEEYKIITLGDYIDRGPKSMQVIDHLMGRTGDTICLQGNHESMMVQSITEPLHPDWWLGNGGNTTLKSYGWGGEPYSQLSYEVVPKAHIEWMANLPLYYETEKQVFVHAGIPQFGMNLPPKNERNFEKMQWMMYSNSDSGGWKGKHVVHGHVQSTTGPHQWRHPKGGRVALDCWAYHTNRLVIGVFDDTQPHALEFIEVVGNEHGYRRNSFTI